MKKREDSNNLSMNVITRYFTELSYDGSRYHGWQVQPNGITVQETLEKAFSTLLKEKIGITGCGRTDTGVHAEFYIAHFDCAVPVSTNELVFKLNSFLPKDIRIHKIYQVDTEMHARYSAKYRKYSYRISRVKPVFNRPFCSWFFGELDISVMNEACRILMEYTDFTSFSKLHTDVKNNNCKIMEAVWKEESDMYVFEIKADRFLRNMVRSIVGTMLDLGSGKMDITRFREVIEAQNRSLAGMSVEAKGLFLVDVGY